MPLSGLSESDRSRAEVDAIHPVTRRESDLWMTNVIVITNTLDLDPAPSLLDAIGIRPLTTSPGLSSQISCFADGWVQ
jgi:hypothetical protein